ncbi:sigma-54 dependent transcriptional regulator [uncultured Maricaulis sp.]|uniref:nitrogen assimilation response regulator NtrX n=1 Tax=uncultured Maricaulis sp. TaxID=174710 RepID=UPI0030DABA20
MARDILIVDDEADIRELIGGLLEDEGYETRGAADSDGAMREFQARQPSLIILDVWLQGSRLDGLELLDEFRAIDPDLPIVVISGHGTIETAVAAIRKGAYDFIEKPFKSDKLLLTLSRALETSRLRTENAQLRARSDVQNALIGNSTSIVQMRQLIERVGPTNSRVLIKGPSGAGKELVARLIHEKSPRCSSDFVAVSAPGMSPEAFDEELFGRENEDGTIKRIGLLERAHGGTLFLDEIADMPRETQSKLLRLLVEQRFRRIGGTADVEVNVRVISSSSQELRVRIEEGKFREDLYHRLAVVPVVVPALAERREDIPELVEHFVARLTHSAGLPRRSFGTDVMAALQAHGWPGNVRQLRNNIERLLILATGSQTAPITLESLPSEVVTRDSAEAGFDAEKMIALSLREARENFEREYLRAQIDRFGGNISRTAAFIGMERSALHRKLKSLSVGGNSRDAASSGQTDKAT